MKEWNVQLGFGFRLEKGWKDIACSNYNRKHYGLRVRVSANLSLNAAMPPRYGWKVEAMAIFMM